MFFAKKVFKCLFGIMCLGSLVPGYGVFYDEPASYLDYQIDDSRYAIVYVEHEDTSDDKAKELALAHAAEIAYKNGYRYFIVESEKQVQVAQTTKPDQPPSNMYQDLIIDREFGRDYIERNAPTGAQLYPGLQLVIKCSKENPGGSSQDVCKWVKCKKK